MNPWVYRAAYVIGTVIIVVAEVAAIVNTVSSDTITENIRNVIFVHPIIWAIALGANAGFAYWFVRHMWWRKK